MLLKDLSLNNIDSSCSCKFHSSPDCGMEWLLCLRIEVSIKLIHSRNYSRNAGRILWKEEGGLFVYLYIKLIGCTYSRTNVMYFKNTHKILNDDPVIMIKFIPSQLENLVCCNLINCCWYVSTNLIISYVEFQHVTMSWGMRCSFICSSWQIEYQAGRVIVVEWMIANDSFHAVIKQNNLKVNIFCFIMAYVLW